MSHIRLKPDFSNAVVYGSLITIAAGPSSQKPEYLRMPTSRSW